MKLILGSKSPRRQQILSEMGYSFEVRVKETDETYPDNLKNEEVAMFIAKEKALALQGELKEDEVLLTADTVVCVDNKILGKPKDEQEAKSMLQLLSNKPHEVITAVCLATSKSISTDYNLTKVYVRALTEEEIDHYITTCQPFDKAGSYGIQEWFGAVAIERIEGSYNNVVGLPSHLVYEMFAENTDLLIKK